MVCVAMVRAQSASLNSKSLKPKLIYQWNFPHRIMYLLSPMFAWLYVWFVLQDVTLTSLTTYDHPVQSVQIRRVIAPAYQKSFGIDYIFLVSHCYIWNKEKTVSKQKLTFCWENLDFDSCIKYWFAIWVFLL